jgi:hypothetical protein
VDQDIQKNPNLPTSFLFSIREVDGPVGAFHTRELEGRHRRAGVGVEYPLEQPASI